MGDLSTAGADLRNERLSQSIYSLVILQLGQCVVM